MLEEFTIFHEGGSVLWSKRFDSGISSSKSNPLNNLISNVLLEVRSPPLPLRRRCSPAARLRPPAGLRLTPLPAGRRAAARTRSSTTRGR